jgi:hypothetical protein
VYVSYLDMASESLRFGPRSLLDLYWSPLYPALLAGWMEILRPAPTAELLCVVVLNWTIFAACCLSFWFFCSGWQSGLQRTGKTMTCLGIAVFFWSVTTFLGVGWVTPDLCVAAIVFLAAGACCRLSAPNASWRMYGFLGAVLSLGYYAKAAMFPIAVLLLLCLLVFPPSNPPKRLGVALAAGVFLLTAAPLIALMSGLAGHPTIGEAGRLNYAWYVDGVQPFWRSVWAGGPPGYGAPIHPVRQLSKDPWLVEFGSPVRGTMPLTRNPAYWYDGVRASFNLTRQLGVLKDHIMFFGQLALSGCVLAGGALALWWKTIGRPMPAFPFSWMVVWPIAVAGMYALVHVENRFLAAFTALFWLAVFGFLLRWADPAAGRAVVVTVVCALALQVGLLYSYGAGKTAWLELSGRGPRPWYLAVAEELERMGIHSGDRLAVVGDPPDYGVRLAGARIVAMYPDTISFWKDGAQNLARTQDQLRKAGIKALLATTADAAGTDLTGWTEIADSDYMVRLIGPTSATP